MSTNPRVLRGRTGVVAPVRSAPVAELTTPVERFDQATKAGFEIGYRDGQAAATRAAATAAAQCQAERAGLGQARQALEAIAAALHEATLGVVGTAVHDVAGAALDLAEAVIGRELELTAQPVLSALQRALAEAPPGSATIRVHPDDAAVLEGVAVPGRLVTLVPDTRVEPGGCLLEIGATTIDAQVSTALGRVRRALVGEGQL